VVGLSIHAVAIWYTIGAAALGLWATVRYPNRGPQRLSTSVTLAAAALALLLASDDLTRVALDAAGLTAALLGVLLPVLTLAFWTSAHVVRLGVERLSQ
jgi:hypothetical protein